MSLKQRAYRVTMTVIVTEKRPNSMVGVEEVATYVEEAFRSWAEPDRAYPTRLEAENVKAEYRWEDLAPGQVPDEAPAGKLHDVMARLDYLAKCLKLVAAAKERITELTNISSFTVDDLAATFKEIEEQAAMAHDAMQQAADIVCAAAGRGKR